MKYDNKNSYKITSSLDKNDNHHISPTEKEIFTNPPLDNPDQILETNRNILTNNQEFVITKISEENKNTSTNFKFNYTFVILLTLNASCGYFFFGYNLTVFNTMQENISYLLNWGEQKNLFISIISSIPSLGAVFGSFLSGKIASLIGRKNSLIIFDLLGIISTLITIISNTYAIILGKLLQGFCMGAFSALVPLYINEYIPPQITGLCGILYNFIWGIGILISFCLGLNLPNPKIENNNWWRIMFVFSGFACFINLIVVLFYFKYDTPKFLYQNKKYEEARYVMRQIYQSEEDINNYIEFLENEKKQDVSYQELLSKKYIKRLFLCLFLNIFQQCTIINAIGLYTNLIYLKDIDQETATFFTVMTAVAEIIGLIVTSFIIEYVGRKLIFLLGLISAFIIHLIISILYHYNFSSPQRYLIILFYFMCGVSIDPIIWIYNADLLPDRGIGICTMVNWITALILIAIFPFMLESKLQLKWTFLLFSVVTLIGFIYALIYMKETKGKVEAEIEEDFK